MTKIGISDFDHSRLILEESGCWMLDAGKPGWEPPLSLRIGDRLPIWVSSKVSSSRKKSPTLPSSLWGISYLISHGVEEDSTTGDVEKAYFRLWVVLCDREVGNEGTFHILWLSLGDKDVLAGVPTTPSSWALPRDWRELIWGYCSYPDHRCPHFVTLTYQRCCQMIGGLRVDSSSIYYEDCHCSSLSASSRISC
jgi:hypothetical protein